MFAYARKVQPVEDATIQGLGFIDVTSGPARFRSVHFEAIVSSLALICEMLCLRTVMQRLQTLMASN